MQISTLNIKYHVLVLIVYRCSRGVEEKERKRERGVQERGRRIKKEESKDDVTRYDTI